MTTYTTKFGTDEISITYPTATGTVEINGKPSPISAATHTPSEAMEFAIRREFGCEGHASDETTVMIHAAVLAMRADA